jgi:hypothetical protein
VSEDATTVAGSRLRLDKSVITVSLVLLVGLILVTYGVLSGVTGDDRANLPALIERVDPVPEAVQVLNQTSVFADLAAGHTGRFIIDGVDIETVGVDELGDIAAQPGVQVDLPPVTIFEPGNSTLTFTPSANAPITEFTEGEHTVQLIYWLIQDGEARARSYTWTFTTV